MEVFNIGLLFLMLCYFILAVGGFLMTAISAFSCMETTTPLLWPFAITQMVLYILGAVWMGVRMWVFITGGF